jgi:hypothetical protein
MATIYLNMKSQYGTETVDEFSREENQSPKEFRLYVNEMAKEYRMAGMDVYKSSRCTKDWRER